MRFPCPHCGGRILGVGWSSERTESSRTGLSTTTEWCRVICRKCSASGPSMRSEAEAWEAWDSRDVVDKEKLDRHLKLCRRNLKSDRVVCCGSCPFEKIIVGNDAGLAPLFDAKREIRGIKND